MNIGNDARMKRMQFDVNAGTGCWEWSLYRDRDGYGNVYFDGITRLAHRAMWMIVNGDIPDGLCVCHKCDVPYCVNPDHLFLGTHADNMRDMADKGRATSIRGEQCGGHKLTERDVLSMRVLYATGEFKFKELGARFGVGEVAAWNAIRGVSWGWLNEDSVSRDNLSFEEDR